MMMLVKFMALISFDKLKKSDAIIYLEGDGFNRVEKVMSLYLDNWAKKVVFSGGAENLSYGSFPGEYIIPQLKHKGLLETDLIWEKRSMHTGEQAINVLQICEMNGWKRVILVASHYHQFRAFMTFFAELRKRKLERKIELINAPVHDLNWFEDDGWGCRGDLIESEFNKIHQYFGEDLTQYYLDIINYFRWKEAMC